MSYSENNLNLTHPKIIIEHNKILMLFQKFWRFSNFYGEYLASLHSQKKIEK